MIGELTVSVPMVEEPERILESLAIRLARGLRAAEAPFADDRRPIAGVLRLMATVVSSSRSG